MHRNPKDKNKSIKWASEIVNNKDKYVILDTETTGLGKRDVILQIAIIDLEGQTLLNSFVKPTKKKRIAKDAVDIHGITLLSLENAPTFEELLPQVEQIIQNKIVLIYNSEYDERLLDQTCEQDEIHYLRIRTECVMKPYSEFKGKWSDYYYDYTFQKLPGGDHSALGDCLATLKVINKMAKTELEIELTENKEIHIVKKWWEFWR
jgi:DNA polymerase-3 subunit epsilon